MLNARTSVLLALALATAPTVRASTIYESGSFTGAYPNIGDQDANMTTYIGWRFTLPQETFVTSLGGSLYLCSFCGPTTGSTMFGAIVPVASLSAFPATPLTFAPVVTALLSPPINYTAGSLTSATVGVDLAAGTYALIFGSGRFGADAGHWASMANIGSNPVPANVMLVGNTGLDQWTSFTNGNYFFVAGNSVPEPGTMPLAAAGIVFALLLYGRRSVRRIDRVHQ